MVNLLILINLIIQEPEIPKQSQEATLFVGLPLSLWLTQPHDKPAWNTPPPPLVFFVSVLNCLFYNIVYILYMYMAVLERFDALYFCSIIICKAFSCHLFEEWTLILYGSYYQLTLPEA